MGFPNLGMERRQSSPIKFAALLVGSRFGLQRGEIGITWFILCVGVCVVTFGVLYFFQVYLFQSSIYPASEFCNCFSLCIVFQESDFALETQSTFVTL